MERWVTNSVITRPVFGFVYMDDEAEKKIFRLKDAAKYSDDTLTRISSTIEQLKGSKFVQNEPIEQIIRGIHEQKEYRRLILQMHETLKNDFINSIDDFPR